MARQKLIRFQENTEKQNLLEPGKPLYETIKGQWHAAYFKNNNPIVLELACGRGEYTTGLALQIPGRNYVGVDVKGDRLWKGAVIAESQGSTNVAFLRAQIQLLENFFAPGEATEIWLTFPDPRKKDRHEKRRLTHPRFLTIYKNIIGPDKLVHLKTDNTDLFDYTLEVLKDFPVTELEYTHDLYHSDLTRYHYGLKTRFEQKYVANGQNIHYLQFKFTE
jgi:tRNA (guanine-N7-)-methyltransferase